MMAPDVAENCKNPATSNQVRAYEQFQMAGDRAALILGPLRRATASSEHSLKQNPGAAFSCSIGLPDATFNPASRRCSPADANRHCKISGLNSNLLPLKHFSVHESGVDFDGMSCCRNRIPEVV